MRAGHCHVAAFGHWLLATGCALDTFGVTAGGTPPMTGATATTSVGSGSTDSATGEGTSDTIASTISPTTSYQVCGDGIIGPDEDCDDGNLDDTDVCKSNCEIAFCGDGIVWRG